MSVGLYAAWAKSSSSLSANAGVTVPTGAQCTRSRYKLLGFSSSASATTASFNPGGSTGSAYYSDTTLYAV